MTKALLPILLSIALLSSCSPAQAQSGPDRVRSERVHPRFALSLQEFQRLAAGQPPLVRSALLGDPAAFLEDYRPLLSGPRELLVLVDKKNSLSENDDPADLVSLNDYPLAVSRSDLKLRARVMPAVLSLDRAARKAGLKLVYSSSFRSFRYQSTVYSRYVREDGQAAADRYSARPGHSQHQLGTVIDFGSITEAFGRTPEGLWLSEHAGEFGFSLSYPDGWEAVTGYMYEPWHYRYLGVEACSVQKKYFGDIQQYFLEFHQNHQEALRAAFEP